MRLGVFALGLATLLASASTVTAQDKIKIGVPLPLSGNAASAGQFAKAGIELAAEIVNDAHPELAPLPLAAEAGLPHLKGAKLELVFADHQGNPSVGQSQTLRLITDEKVVAFTGGYQSSVVLTSSAVAERYGVPWVCGEAVAATLTQRGFKGFFRVTPIAPDFGKAYMEFLAELKAKGQKVDKLAIVNENTEYGTSVAGAIRDAAKKAGFAVALEVPYNANSTDVSSQVLQLKSNAPDAVIFISYTADAILYAKTMRNLDYRPPIMIADDAGFADPAFVDAAADAAQGLINRSSWDIGKPGSVTAKLNELYKAKTQRDLDDTTAREMQGLFVLADAIDRAGSTDPEKIKAALRATDLKPDQLIMGYDGVKFDETGQNTLAATYLIELFGKQYAAVWPTAKATRPLELPFKGWK